MAREEALEGAAEEMRGRQKTANRPASRMMIRLVVMVKRKERIIQASYSIVAVSDRPKAINVNPSKLVEPPILE
jgi:hypothetical protein